jgi:cephalosporin-C deacetylase-like acetyl esterase
MRILLCFAAFLGLGSAASYAASPPAPAGEKLDWQGPLDERMMDGLHKFIERKLDDAAKNRERFWKREFSSDKAVVSPTEFRKSIAANVARLKKILGILQDSDSSFGPESFGSSPHRTRTQIAEGAYFRVLEVEWKVFDGLSGEGLLLMPKAQPVGFAVVVPDAGQSPEALLADHSKMVDLGPMARLLASNRCAVIIPRLIDREFHSSGHREIEHTNEPHREWLWRQGYHVGRHPLGLEVQKIRAAVRLVREYLGRREPRVPTAVLGYGEGGLLALYAAALDTSIDACLISGCFDPRPKFWEEPIYRHIWKVHQEFGDAQIAAMIWPRTLVIEHSAFPRIEVPATTKGRSASAAAGALHTPDFSAVKEEINRLTEIVPKNHPHFHFISGTNGETVSPGSPEAWKAIRTFRLEGPEFRDAEPFSLPSKDPFKAEEGTMTADDLWRINRQARQVVETERFLQTLVENSNRVRDAEYLDTLPKSLTAEQWEPRAAEFRKRLWETHLGKFTDPYLPLNPRVRQIYDREKWTGYDIVLDIFPDVFAWGVLLVPKDIQEGERRPVVVCQHGRNGLPKDVIEGDVKAYHDFAAKLCDRGFIVFAPHNPYRGEDKYRYLSRKANGIGCTLFSFILAQHEQILSWLGTLPYVDDQRIAFYGLSYGGETAVRVPPLLTKYCLSICSADFNMWTRKVASTEERFCFPYTIEWEMPYWDMGNHFDYAEMAYLMAPRPFMVERGHRDGVSKDEWVAYEYAKVRRFYDELGIGDRTEIEFFNGVHEINGQGTFEFLHKHLKWPKR